jgi:hypothetical protein
VCQSRIHPSGGLICGLLQTVLMVILATLRYIIYSAEIYCSMDWGMTWWCDLSLVTQSFVVQYILCQKRKYFHHIIQLCSRLIFHELPNPWPVPWFAHAPCIRQQQYSAMAGTVVDAVYCWGLQWQGHHIQKCHKGFVPKLRNYFSCPHSF